jgi:hypothetical protein
MAETAETANIDVNGTEVSVTAVTLLQQLQAAFQLLATKEIRKKFNRWGVPGPFNNRWLEQMELALGQLSDLLDGNLDGVRGDAAIREKIEEIGSTLERLYSEVSAAFPDLPRTISARVDALIQEHKDLELKKVLELVENFH